MFLCFVRYFSGFKQSAYHSKHQIDVLTGSELHLCDILYDDTAFSYFTEVTPVVVLVVVVAVVAVAEIRNLIQFFRHCCMMYCLATKHSIRPKK